VLVEALKAKGTRLEHFPNLPSVIFFAGSICKEHFKKHKLEKQLEKMLVVCLFY